MAKHVRPPFDVGVADTSSVDLNLDVNRVITAFTIFGGSGGDLGVADTSARSDHTHITSYDGRYVLKAGDTMAGNLIVSKADAQIALVSTNAGNSALYAYDTTDGGGVFFSSDGNVIIAQVDTSGIWVTNRFVIDKASGSIGLYPSGLNVIANHASFPGLDIVEAGVAVTFRVRANVNNLAYIQFTDATASAERAALVATATALSLSTGTGGFSFNRALTVLPKGSIFGQAIGGNTALVQSDAAIITYANSANNWAGLGSDSSGNIWFRTGLSGTPDARLIIQTGGTIAVAGSISSGNLSGAGNRVVQADNAGLMSVPVAPTITDLTNMTHTHQGASSGGVLGGGAGASMVLLYTNTFAAAAALSLPNNIFSSTYPFYLIKVVGVTLNTANAGLYWRGRVAGTDDSGASSYKYHGTYMTTGGASTNFGGSSNAAVFLPGIVGTIITTSASVWLENPTDGTLFTMARAEYEGTWNGSDWYGGWSSGQYSSSRSHDSMSFVASSGTVALGVYVWGFRFT